MRKRFESSARTKLSMHGAMTDGSPRGSNPLTFSNDCGLAGKEVRVLSAHKYCPSACLGGASPRQGEGGQFKSVRGNKNKIMETGKLIYTEKAMPYILEALGYKMDKNGMVHLPDGSMIHRNKILGFKKGLKNGVITSVFDLM